MPGCEPYGQHLIPAVRFVLHLMVRIALGLPEVTSPVGVSDCFNDKVHHSNMLVTVWNQGQQCVALYTEALHTILLW
jgi:hypothetical protein